MRNLQNFVRNLPKEIKEYMADWYWIDFEKGKITPFSKKVQELNRKTFRAFVMHPHTREICVATVNEFSLDAQRDFFINGIGPNYYIPRSEVSPELRIFLDREIDRKEAPHIIK